MTFTGVSTVATSTSINTTSSRAGAWTVSSGTLPLTAGHLLVAVATVEATTSATIPTTVTAGWSQVGTGILSNSRVGISIWAKTAVGSDTAPTFTSTVAGSYSGLHVTLYELASVVAAGAVFGTNTGTTANPLTATTSANVTSANSVAIGVHALYTGSNASDAWTKAATFTAGVNTGTTTARYHTASDYLNNPSTGATLACAGTWGSAGTYEAAMVVAFPAAPVPETSPSLEVYGFPISGPGASDTINSVTVAVTEHQSSASQAACTYELWDYSGTPAKIGATQTGTASTSTANISTAAFSGVTYAMLATLRVRVFGHAPSASGYIESVDGVSLVVNYTAAGGATVTPAIVTAGAAFPGVTTAASIQSILARATTMRVDIPMIGDSIVEGWGASTVAANCMSTLNAAIRIQYPGGAAGTGGGLGFINIQTTGEATYSWPISIASGAPSDYYYDCGPVREGFALGQACSLTFTAPAGTTSVRIMYDNLGSGTAGTFSWKIGAGSTTNVSNSGTATAGVLTGSISITSGQVLTIAWVSGTMHIDGLVHFAGDEASGLTFHNCGHTSWDCSTGPYGWMQTGSGNDWRIPSASLFANGFFGVYLGINDCNSLSPGGGSTAAQYQANLTALINYIRGNATFSTWCLLFIPYQPYADGVAVTYKDVGGWPAYRTAALAVAASVPNCTIIDLTADGFPQPTSSAGGTYFYDGIHPNNAGYSLMASHVASDLALGIVTPATLAVATTFPAPTVISAVNPAILSVATTKPAPTVNVLPPISTILAQAATMRVDIPVIGDSITEGYGCDTFTSRSWTVVNSKVRAIYPGGATGTSGGLGYINIQSTGTDSLTWPITNASGSPGNSDSDNGPVRTGVLLTKACTYTWTAPAGTSSVKIMWDNLGSGTAGSFTYKVGSGGTTTVSNSGTATNGVLTSSITITSGQVLTIAWVSGTCSPDGIVHYAGDEASGLTFHAFGRTSWDCSTGSYGWRQTGEDWRPGQAACMTNGFFGVFLGMNDCNADAPGGGFTAAVFQTNLTAVINYIRGNAAFANAWCMLVFPYEPYVDGSNVTLVSTWAAYRTAVQTVVTTLPNCLMVDLGTLGMPSPPGSGGGTDFYDGIHPNDAGANLLAGYVTGALASPSVNITPAAFSVTTTAPAPVVRRDQTVTPVTVAIIATEPATTIWVPVTWNASGGGTTGTTSSATYTWSHTTAATTMLVAGVAVDANPDSMTLTCQLDGVLMTLQKVIHCNNGSGGYLAAFTTAGVSSGAHTLLATASSAPLHLCGGSLSFSGGSGSFNIYPVTPSSGNGYGSSALTSAVSDIPTTPGGMIAAFCAAGSDGIAAGAGTTSRWMDNYATGQEAGASGAETIASNGSAMTVGFTCTDDWWAEILVEVLPAAGGSATVYPTILATSAAFPAPVVRQDQAVTPATVAITTAFSAPSIYSDVYISPATLAVTTTKPAPAISPGPATFPATVSFASASVSPAPVTFAITTARPPPAVSPGPATFTISTTELAPAVSPGPATFAVSTAFPAPTVTGSGGSTNTSPAYAVSYGTGPGGYGTWVNPAHAEGVSDTQFATWTAP